MANTLFNARLVARVIAQIQVTSALNANNDSSHNNDEPTAPAIPIPVTFFQIDSPVSNALIDEGNNK